MNAPRRVELVKERLFKEFFFFTTKNLFIIQSLFKKLAGISGSSLIIICLHILRNKICIFCRRQVCLVVDFVSFAPVNQFHKLLCKPVYFCGLFFTAFCLLQKVHH